MIRPDNRRRLIDLAVQRPDIQANLPAPSLWSTTQRLVDKLAVLKGEIRRAFAYYRRLRWDKPQVGSTNRAIRNVKRELAALGYRAP